MENVNFDIVCEKFWCKYQKNGVTLVKKNSDKGRHFKCFIIGEIIACSFAKENASVEKEREVWGDNGLAGVCSWLSEWTLGYVCYD